MSNRVEDLEKQVAELQAAVNGLTEELVETKERVRQLEDADDDAVVRGAQPAAAPEATARATEGTDAAADRGPAEQTTKSDAHADVVETAPADGTGDVDDVAASSSGDAAPTDEGGDDVLIAGEDEVPSESKPDTPKGEGAKEEDDDGESEDSDIIVA